jgi:hypothetical protein
MGRQTTVAVIIETIATKGTVSVPQDGPVPENQTAPASGARLAKVAATATAHPMIRGKGQNLGDRRGYRMNYRQARAAAC